MSPEEISSYQYQIDELLSILDRDKLVAVYHNSKNINDVYDLIAFTKKFDNIENCIDIADVNIISELTKHIARYHEFDSIEIKKIASEYRGQDWNLTDQDKEMRDSFIRLCLAMCRLGSFLIILPDTIFGCITKDDLSIFSELRRNTNCKILICISSLEIFNKFSSEVSLFKFYNMTENKNSSPLVFISHHWDEESDKYTQCLQHALEDAGIHYFIDTNDGKNRTKITDMEKKIGDGFIVVPIINDLYLKSIDCMYELALAKENGHINERLFPLLLCDIERNGHGLQEQLDYWENENENYKHTSEQLGLGRANIANKEIVRVDLIASNLSKLWEYFKEYLTLSKEVLSANNFELMIKDIKQRLALLQGPSITPTPSERIPSGNSPSPAQSIGSSTSNVIQTGDHAVYIDKIEGNVTFNQ